MSMERNENMNQAKLWQIAFFACNEVATNLYLYLMMYVSYYAVGIVGLGTVLVSNLVMGMRIFDGFTDPIVGYLVDKTNGRFGKNRPFLVIGNVILALSVIVMYQFTHRMPDMMKLPFFVLVYTCYIIGYTFQCVVTKSAQSCLTNDPKQRPMFAMFAGTYNAILAAVIALLVSGTWVKQYGGFTQELFNTFMVFTVASSMCFTALAVIGIRSKDRQEFFGAGKPVKIRFRDYWEVLKNNRAIQMLVLSAASDKLALQVRSNSTVAVVVYGIVCCNFEAFGQMSSVIVIPNLFILLFGVGVIARRMGQRKALLYGSLGAIVFTVLNILLFIFGDPTTLSFTSFNFFTVAFVLLYILAYGCSSVSSSIVIPMTADCADYEVYRSGRYVPGLMGTLFSFVDKLISSFATTIVGLLVASIGFTQSLPQVDTPYSSALFAVGIFCLFGLPVIGWVLNLVAMRFYPLTKEKMEEIQDRIAEIKRESLAKLEREGEV